MVAIQAFPDCSKVYVLVADAACFDNGLQPKRNHTDTTDRGTKHSISPYSKTLDNRARPWSVPRGGLQSTPQFPNPADTNISDAPSTNRGFGEVNGTSDFSEREVQFALRFTF